MFFSHSARAAGAAGALAIALALPAGAQGGAEAGRPGKATDSPPGMQPDSAIKARVGPAADSLRPAIRANGIVGLLTDYGDIDFYLGALKGIVLRTCPRANLVDLSHNVPPYDVTVAAWQLYDSAREFPSGTVFVAVVDPGVGTGRRPLLFQTRGGYWFVGPDNGLFTVVEREMGPGVYRVIENHQWMRPGPISASFHGRDIFGPTAGRLACGDPAEEAGPVVDDPVRLELRQARLETDSTGATVIVGQILFVDHYGNLQTNIRGEMLDLLHVPRGTLLTVQVDGTTRSMPLVRVYGDVPEGDPLIFVASTGRLEIARNQDSADDLFNARPEAKVVLKRYR
jgi:S-adenosyl-L-methionine hydrolase (adenosine-forming)